MENVISHLRSYDGRQEQSNMVHNHGQSDGARGPDTVLTLATSTKAGDKRKKPDLMHLVQLEGAQRGGLSQQGCRQTKEDKRWGYRRRVWTS